MPKPLPSDFFMDYWPYVHEPAVDDAARFFVEFKVAARYHPVPV
jgi:hypothetical protein